MDDVLDMLMNQIEDGHPPDRLTEEQIEMVPIVKVGVQFFY